MSMMQNGRLVFYLTLIWLLGGVVDVPAQPLPGLVGATIREIQIRHVGPPSVSDAFVRARIHAQVGQPLNANEVDQDVRDLYASGRFYNVQVQTEPVDDGVRLVYVLEDKPVLSHIEFVGNTKFSERRLLKAISSKVGDPLDERKLFEDARAIEKLYQGKGYRETKVKYTPVVDTQTGRGTVRFEINEAGKVLIHEVRFVGATAFSEKELRKVLKTRRRWFLSWLTGSGVLKEDVLQEDRFRLVDFYREHGYVDFQIKDVRTEEIKPGWIDVVFEVEEGRQYHVGHISFEGNTVFTGDELLSNAMPEIAPGRFGRGLKMGPGEIFSPSGLRNDTKAILNLYGTKGYIDAEVKPELMPNTITGTIDIVYHITEGRPSYVEKIVIEGNTKTKDKVIRRELAIKPGELFDTTRIAVSTNRLYGLDYFSRVQTSAEQTDVPDRKNLVIEVEEKSTGNVRVGAGFSSVDQLVGFVELTQGNADITKFPPFLGTGAGQKLRLVSQIGTVRKDFIFTFIEPWFLDRKLAFGTDLYYRDIRFYSDLYDVERYGARFSLTKALWNENWQGTLSYTIEDQALVNMRRPYQREVNGQLQWYDPVPPAIRADEGDTWVSKIGLGLAYDTRNSPLLPDRGQRTGFEIELAGGPFGGDADFYRLELNSAHYFRGIFEGHIIEVIGRIGTVATYDGSDHVPLFERYFLGGLYSLRGYKYRAIGPYDIERDEPIGGQTFWFGSVEYSIPLIPRLRFAVFYDIGNVYPNAFSFNTAGPGYKVYNDNWGVGIRLHIPGLGPIRLDYAIPITHDRYVSGAGRFQFSAGYTRSY